MNKNMNKVWQLYEKMGQRLSKTVVAVNTIHAPTIKDFKQYVIRIMHIEYIGVVGSYRAYQVSIPGKYPAMRMIGLYKIKKGCKTPTKTQMKTRMYAKKLKAKKLLSKN